MRNLEKPDVPDCPNCSMPLHHATIIKNKIDRFNLDQRLIYAHCLECGKSCEIQQLLVDGQWLTIRFRYYVSTPQAWQKVNEIPVPVVAIGVSKEFDECLV